MATLQPPSSQKAGDRPISFLLDNQSSGAPIAFVDMVIRPEELTVVETSKISVQQTFGGAWADSFGPGIPTINLSGTTGWRRTASSDDDGLARFLRLRDTVYTRWHELRAQNTDQGVDPNQVRLIFSDALDELSYVVAPMNFVLRRSKSRPLLAQFQISLLVLDTALQNTPFPAQFGYNGATDPIAAAAKQATGLQSLTSSINAITSKIASVRSMVDATLVAPVQSFMNQTAQLYGAVRGAIAEGQAVVSDIVGVAQMTAQAGVNLFRTLAAVASLPQMVKADVMAVASAYSNVFCVLRNALNLAKYVGDYTSLYGSSNCSSTSGGRPESSIAGVNPFYSVVPTPGPIPLSITPSSRSALSTIAANDPVLSPMSTASLRAELSQAVYGMAVA